MEIPSVVLPTQHVGQNHLVPVDHVQMMRWTPAVNNAIWRFVTIPLILPPPNENGRITSSVTINGLNCAQATGSMWGHIPAIMMSPKK